MRPGQQNKRMRGRNRKGPNPMARVYESNGPDVKIRGNAAHIAEKYTTLARDASSSGDYIAAENYLQHAEHYYRIIAAAQAQAQPQNQQPGTGRDEDGREDDDNEGDNRFAPPAFMNRGPQHNQSQNTGHGAPRANGAERAEGRVDADGPQPTIVERDEAHAESAPRDGGDGDGDGDQPKRGRGRRRYRRKGEDGEQPEAASGEGMAPTAEAPTAEASPAEPAAEAQTPRPRRGRPPKAAAEQPAPESSPADNAA